MQMIQMKTKLLRKARNRFKIEHVHNLKMLYRLVEYTDHEIKIITPWLDYKTAKMWERKFILLYCRSVYDIKNKKIWNLGGLF